VHVPTRHPARTVMLGRGSIRELRAELSTFGELPCSIKLVVHYFVARAVEKLARALSSNLINSTASAYLLTPALNRSLNSRTLRMYRRCLGLTRRRPSDQPPPHRAGANRHPLQGSLQHLNHPAAPADGYRQTAGTEPGPRVSHQPRPPVTPVSPCD